MIAALVHATELLPNCYRPSTNRSDFYFFKDLNRRSDLDLLRLPNTPSGSSHLNGDKRLDYTKMAPSTATEVPPPPAVSIKTLHIAGILVDIHGLAELPPTATQISVLWLHHPRTRSKEQMIDIAARAVSAWNASPKSSNGGGNRGLIAAAFDQRNHGSREVLKLANEAWRGGNPTHAQDMFGVVAGTVADTRGLIDLLPGYLFHEEGGEAARTIDQHLVLGWSLGGHSCWQLLFADPRVTAGVSVIGCPDFMCECAAT